MKRCAYAHVTPKRSKERSADERDLIGLWRGVFAAGRKNWCLGLKVRDLWANFVDFMSLFRGELEFFPSDV